MKKLMMKKNKLIEEGVYYIYSCVPYLKAVNIDEFNKLVKFFYEGQNVEGFSYWSDKQVQDSISTFTGVFHEREHYNQYQTTTFGLLYWRLMQVIKINVSRICLTILKCEGYNKIEFPLFEWVFSNGKKFIEDNPPILGRDFSIYQKRGLGDRYIAKEIKIFNKCIDELEVLLDFYDQHMLSDNINIVEFNKLANKAIGILSFRSRLDYAVEFNVDFDHLEDSDKSFFKTIDVIEAGARLQELIILLKTGANQNKINEWRVKYLSSNVDRIINLIIDRCNFNFSRAQTLIDLSLAIPGDPSCGAFIRKPIDILSFLPGYRLSLFFHLLRDKKDLLSTIDDSEFLKIIRNALIDFSPTDDFLYGQLVDSDLNKNINFGTIFVKEDSSLQDAPGDSLIFEYLKGYEDLVKGPSSYYIEKVISTYKEAFFLRTTNKNICFAFESRFLPIMEFFSGGASFNTQYNYIKKEKFLNIENYIYYFFNMIESMTWLKLFGVTDDLDIVHLVELFSERLKKYEAIKNSEIGEFTTKDFWINYIKSLLRGNEEFINCVIGKD